MTLQFLLSETPVAAVMFDDRNGTAFGPVVLGDDCMERLSAFLSDLNDDPRALRDWELSMAWAAWESGSEAPAAVAPADDVAVTPAVSPTVDDTLPIDADRDDPGPFPAQPAPPPSPGPATPDPSPVPGAAPATFDSVDDSGARVQATAPAPAPVQPPVGTRECWNCHGTRHEPNHPEQPCGICGAQGWLPA